MMAALVGFLLGFVGSIPAAGPLALTIVSAAIQRNRGRALRLAVSGALAESIWATLAVAGLGHVVLSRPELADALRIIGIAVLCALGVALLRAKPGSTAGETSSAARGAGELALGFVLIATNPGFLIAW